MIWYSPLVPLSLAVAFLVMAAFLARRRLAIIGLFLLLPAYGLMTPLGANLLVLVVEQRVKAGEAAPVCNEIQAVVLLSGGLNRPPETTIDFGALTPETLDRLFSWRANYSLDGTEATHLIIAGGGPFRIPEAAVMDALMRSLDTTDRHYDLEILSSNTRESARAVAEMLPAHRRKIAVASSALHLPRAKFAFEQAGFEVCPWPLNRHYMAVTGWTILLPNSSSLAKSESALHELIGEVHYRIN